MEELVSNRPEIQAKQFAINKIFVWLGHESTASVCRRPQAEPQTTYSWLLPYLPGPQQAGPPPPSILN